MPTAPNAWMLANEKWFASHPEREFRITEIPLESLAAMSSAGWLAGIASQHSNSGSQVNLLLPEEATAVPCVIRWADSTGGRPLPSVLLMDGAGRLPPEPPAADPARSQEMLAAEIWRLAQFAADKGVSLIDLLYPGLART